MIDKVRVILISRAERFLSSLSLGASWSACFSYSTKQSQALRSGLKTVLMISAVFLVPILAESHLPRDHLTRHGDCEVRERSFSFTARLSRFLSPNPADFSKGVLSLATPDTQKKWQLRHPRFCTFTSALLIGGAIGGIKMPTYFLAAFLGVVSGFSLGGRPLPGTLRIASMADLSYKTSFVTGFIPALKSRCFAVKYVISSLSAISDIVRYSPVNFIPSLSVNVSKRFNFYKILEKMYFFDTFYIDFNVSMRYNYT
jgi:hypothetical protein